MNVDGKHSRTVWMDGPTVKMINQPLLPHRFEITDLPTYRDTARAIKVMTVRGAGAIGGTAGYAMAQAALEARDAHFGEDMALAAEIVSATRPTAQNLFYAVRRVLRAIEAEGSDVPKARQAAVAEAQAIADDDAACCEAIGRHGAELIQDGFRLSTHCNAGWLAFVDWGSALSPMFVAHRQGKKLFVFVDETKPRGQGARLTAWELLQEGIDHAIICDNATGHYMRTGQIDMVIVGSDRIAANGDVANKIGTYSSAVVAKANGIPFYVAAPTTTIDPDCPSGNDIPIEERDQDEVRKTWGWSDDGEFLAVRTAPEGSPARNPAFDVTPAEYVAGIITEKGIVPATPEGIASVARKD
ncbi:MAG: S-methyl-5-thioribose-1-phosphate isomerase [Proteobacteria bacterium]|nr:S-methyl-5-thioribose-1-phosphate isomerase [Pseudomonadota bacterium]MCP4915456.1 S-methyl-5-thioribose-1-phosphate isomerase [Pseudomonadota bacterium]